jgi:hypothetical protein
MSPGEAGFPPPGKELLAKTVTLLTCITPSATAKLISFYSKYPCNLSPNQTLELTNELRRLLSHMFSPEKDRRPVRVLLHF